MYEGTFCIEVTLLATLSMNRSCWRSLGRRFISCHEMNVYKARWLLSHSVGDLTGSEIQAFTPTHTHTHSWGVHSKVGVSASQWGWGELRDFLLPAQHADPCWSVCVCVCVCVHACVCVPLQIKDVRRKKTLQINLGDPQPRKLLQHEIQSVSEMNYCQERKKKQRQREEREGEVEGRRRGRIALYLKKESGSDITWMPGTRWKVNLWGKCWATQFSSSQSEFMV